MKPTHRRTPTSGKKMELSAFPQNNIWLKIYLKVRMFRFLQHSRQNKLAKHRRCVHFARIHFLLVWNNTANLCLNNNHRNSRKKQLKMQINQIVFLNAFHTSIKVGNERNNFQTKKIILMSSQTLMQHPALSSLTDILLKVFLSHSHLVYKHNITWYEGNE